MNMSGTSPDLSPVWCGVACFLVESGGAVVGDLDLGTYFRPHFGDTMIVGGVEAECDPLVWLDDTDTCNPNVTIELFENQGYRAARRVPGTKIPRQPKGVGAAYDVSGDWVPIYDRTNVGGYYLAIGTSGNQFKNAPIAGGIMTTLIEACDRGRDHDTTPVTYHCHRINRQLNIGHYSRPREADLSVGGRSVRGGAVWAEAAEAQAVGHHKQRRQTHGSGCDHGVQHT